MSDDREGDGLPLLNERRRHEQADRTMENWSPEEEAAFQRDMAMAGPWGNWRRDFKARFGGEPNIAPGGDYNYRMAWRHGAAPQPYEHDQGHYHGFSSAAVPPYGYLPLKAQGHPTAWMEKFMQHFGVDPHEATPEQMQEAKRLGILPQQIPGFAAGGLYDVGEEEAVQLAPDLSDEWVDVPDQPDLSAPAAAADEWVDVPEPKLTWSDIGQHALELPKGIPQGAGGLVGGAMVGAGTIAHAQTTDQTRLFDRIDRGEPVPLSEDPYQYQLLDPEGRRAFRQQFDAVAATPLHEDPLIKAGTAIKEKSDIFPAAPGFEGSVTRQLGVGLGSMIGGAALSILSPLTAAATFTMAGAGEAVDRAIQAGASQEQIVAAARAGMLPGLTDSVPIETLVGRVPMPGGQLIKVPAGMLGKAIRAIGRIGWTAFQEGVQEGGQEFLQNLIAREIYKPDQDLTEGVPGAAGLGAGVGGIAQAGADILGAGIAGGRRGIHRYRTRNDANFFDTEEPGEAGAPPPPPAPPQAPSPPPGPLPGQVVGEAPPPSDAPTGGDISTPPGPTVAGAPPLSPAEAAAGAFEEHMADGRTADEVRADEAAAEEQAIAGLRERLPPGFKIERLDDGGPFEILAPNDMHVTSLEPGQINQDAIDRALGIAGVINEQVDFGDDLRVGDGSRANPVVVQQPTDIAAAGQNVAEPVSDAQAEAGNYQKGHVKIGGLDVTIENPMGSTRSGTDPDGKPWSVEMPYDYGYIKRTNGADGDHVDILLGPGAHEAEQGKVWVIDQIDPVTGKFDEHKSMVGFPTRDAAEEAYRAGFSDGSGQVRMGAVTEMGWPQFRRWATSGNTKKALTYRDTSEWVDVAPEQEAAPAPKNVEAQIRLVAKEAGISLTAEEVATAADWMTNEGMDARGAVRRLVMEAAVSEEEHGAFIAPPGFNETLNEPEAQPDEQGVRGSGEAAVPEGGEAAEPVSQPPAPPAPSGEQPPPGGQAGAAVERPAPAPRPAATETVSGGDVAQGADEGQPGTGRPDGGAEPTETGAGVSGFRGEVPAPPPQEPEAPQAEPGQTARNYGTPDEPNQIAMAEGFRDAFASGQNFTTIVQARKLASGWINAPILPGTKLAKAVDEAIEIGAVMAARQMVKDAENAPAAFDRLLTLYNDQMPNLSVRSGDSMLRQAYSTPLPLGFAVSRMVGASKAGKVYEPTAGNGALVLEVEPASAIVNELDADRRAALEAQGMKPTEHDASDWRPAGSYDVVVANPPFGVIPVAGHRRNKQFDMGFVQPGYTTTQIDHAIALKALEGLPDGGRAALILGGISKQVKDPQARSDAYNGKMKREFFFTLYGKYNVVDHFTIPGELYAGQGAAWPIDVVIIDGRGKSDRKLPSLEAPRIVSGWDEVRRIMQEGDKTNAVASTRTTPTDVAAPDEGAPSMEPGPATENAPGGAGGGGGGAGPGAVSGPASGPSSVASGGGAQPGTGGGGPRGGAGSGGAVQRPASVRGTRGGAGAAATGQPAATPEAPPGGAPGGETALETGERPGERGAVEEQQPTGLGGPSGVERGGTQQLEEDLAAPPPDLGAQIPRPPRKKGDAANAAQAVYEPASDAESVGTLVPVNMGTATRLALQSIEAANGKIDAWVAQKLDYPPKDIPKYFSAEQVDAIAMAIQQVDAGRGFVIGDQTGVGKGRVVAAMIRYSLRQGLVPIFATEGPNLYEAMARDLANIGMADVLPRVLMTNNGVRIPYTDDPKGPAFESPGVKTHEATLREVASSGKLPDGKDVLFTTYSQMQQQAGSDTTRMAALRSLAPKAFLILDESHNAGGTGAGMDRASNGKMTRSVFVRQLVMAARSVFYSSGTWAKRPNVLDLYGIKTDMALAVENIGALADAISRGGIPMQQIVSAMLAQTGQYVRREKSFADVTYDLTDIPVEKETYDNISRVLNGIFTISERYVKASVRNISNELKADAASITPDGSTGGAGASSTSFSSVMHNLISQMLLASKAKGAVDRAVHALKNDEKPVIALANTMGSFIEEFAAEAGARHGDPLDLTFNSLLRRYLQRTLVYKTRKPFSNEPAETHVLTLDQLGPAGAALYRRLEKMIGSLDLSTFPVSPIDYIRAELVRAGYKVGEITGRTHAADYRADGTVVYRVRPQKELTAAGRVKAANDFNAGPLDALIINEAGSTGISLHANAPFKDRRRRVMIIAQANLNVTTHMQTLGRVLRTGEVVKPRYEQLVADIPAEKRPAAVIAAKMASLSASTTANRRGVVGSKAAVDFINKYGGQVIDRYLAENTDLWDAMGRPTAGSDDGSSQDYEEIARKVTGHVPLMLLGQQEQFYEEVERRYENYLAELDASGENALEAKTLELDAKQISTQVMIEGKGSSPFEAPVHAGLYDVKRVVKPPSAALVLSQVGRSLRGQEYDTGLKSDASVAEVAAALVALADEAETVRLEHDLAAVDRATNTALQKAEEIIDPAAQDRAKRRVADAQNIIQSVLREATVGSVVRLTTNGTPQLALVTSVKMDGKNAAARSSWTIGFLMDDGIQRHIPISQVYTEDNKPLSASPDDVARTVKSTRVSVRDYLTSLTAHSHEAREERWIITGNLLAGYADAEGQIINFYDHAGDVHQGIMMARDWSLDKHEAAKAQVMRGSLAVSFLQVPNYSAPHYVETSNGAVKVTATDRRGLFLIDVPGSRREGAVYFGDSNLAALMQGGDFFKMGPKMRGRFQAEDLSSVIEVLEKIAGQQQTYLVSSHPEAKAFAAEQRPASPGGGSDILQRINTQLSVGVDAPRGGEYISPEAFKVFLDAVNQITGGRTKVEVVTGLRDRLTGKPIDGITAGGTLMRVALAGEPLMGWTMHHEAVHALRTLGLIEPSEWTALERAASREDWIGRYDTRGRYEGATEERILEEAVADAFGEYSGKRRPMPAGMIGRAVRRVMTFFERLKSALQGKGFTRAEDIFERMLSGAMGRRTAKPVRGRYGPHEAADMAIRRDAYWDETAPQNGAEDPNTVAIRTPTGEIETDLMAGLPPSIKAALQDSLPGARKRTDDMLNWFWGRPGDRRIKVVEPEGKQDIGFWKYLASPVLTPSTLFSGDRQLASFVRQGIEAEENLSKWNHELTRDYEAIGRKLAKAGGSFAAVADALFQGDANEVDTTDAAELQELFDATGLSEAEQTAFKEYTKHLEKVARFIDNHRRSMHPAWQTRKAKIFQRMQNILNRATLPQNTTFALLYNKRRRLTQNISHGRGDLRAQAEEVEQINADLRALRAADPTLQAQLWELQEEYDALEAKLSATHVRGRRKGYIPHRFFGSWRLHEWVADEALDDGGYWKEITSDQGFYNTRSDAIAAAKKFLSMQPDSRLRIEPRMPDWPAGLNATELSDRSYHQARREISEATGLEGKDLNDLLRGVIRRRFRRRLLSAARYRKGATGYSRDLDRVFRTHMSSATRYVVFDKLKYRYVNMTEAVGLSPKRGETVQERPALQRAFESWWRDLNGQKQPIEQRIDNILRATSMPIPVLTASLGATSLATIAGLGPIWTPMIGTYFGYRMYKALRDGGDFPFRSLNGALVGDMAHLKLGMVTNIRSAAVNLTQTALTTYPVLGEKWTGVGIKRAIEALWDQAVGRQSPGSMLLDRAGVRTQFHLTDHRELGGQAEPLWRRLSMLGFNTTETFNRAAAFMGAYARAEAAGKSPAQAMREAQDIMRRTQFHYGNADKPAFLRSQIFRVAGQFKNFMVQLTTFAFGLRGAELPRFLAALFLLSGALGFAGMQLLDGLTRFVTGNQVRPTSMIKEAVVNTARESGQTAGNVAAALAYGLPAYFLGTSMSASVGMGDRFMPTSPRDFAGPLGGTLVSLSEAQREGAGVVDQLAALSPSFKWVQALETAADGNRILSEAFWKPESWMRHSRTDWRHRGALVYHPSTSQVVQQGLGFTPLEETIRRDARGTAIERKELARGSADSYLARIVDAKRGNRFSDVAGIMQEARKNKVHLSPQMVRNALRAAEEDINKRTQRDTPRRDRMRVLEQRRGIETLFPKGE